MNQTVKQGHLQTQYNKGGSNFGIEFGKPVRLSNIKRKHLSTSRQELEIKQKKKNACSLNKENLMTSNNGFQRVVTQQSTVREDMRASFLPKLNQKNMKQQPQQRLQRVRSQRNMEQSVFEMIGSYRVGGVLGKGSYAAVRLARNWKGSTFAVKVYQKSTLKDSSFKMKNVNNQIEILSSLNHPNILKFVEGIYSGDSISIVTELLDNTSLIEWLKFQPKKIAPRDDMRKIMKSILQSLKYIHNKNISHRDLKMENILIGKGLKIKMIDFGFAIKDDHLHTEFCGTPHYISPEIISKGGYLGKPADIWAAGIIFYKLHTGEFPFKGMNNKALYRKICRGDLLFPNNEDSNASEVQGIIRSMLNMDPSFRPSASDLLRQPWFGKEC